MNNNKIIISFYYQHKQEALTERLYRAYLALAQLGYQVHYFSVHPLAVEHPNIHPHFINVKAQEGSSRFWLSYFFQAIREAKALGKQCQIEGYVVFSFFYGALATLASSGTHEKKWIVIRNDALVSSQNKSYSWLRRFIHKRLEMISLKSSDRIICANKYMMERLVKRSAFSQKMAYLPDEIPYSAQATIPRIYKQGIWKFVTASDLTPENNQLSVLKALAGLSAKNWHYRIIGTDSENTGYEQLLRDFVFEHHLSKHVEFMGKQEGVREIIAESNLFILPSTLENSASILLEALATGVPCIGSNAASVTEILTPPSLIFPHDSTVSLQNMLNRFIHRESIRTDITAKTALCRQRHKFDWEARLIGFVEGSEDQGSRLAQRIVSAKYQVRG